MQTKLLQKFLWFFMIIMAVSGAYIYGYILKANGDNVEHLHASWLVWMGYIPYKDFFQHHNPLTWYLFAPFVADLIDNPKIFAVFNIVGVITLCFIAYYQGKILILNGNSKLSALFVAAIMISSYSILWSTDFRPDTFMYLFFFIGMYYLFSYRRNSRTQSLILSFLYFFISFMFTQKILLNMVIPGGAVLYWLCTKKIKIHDLIYATIAPVILFGAFLLYLYYHDALAVYWKANFIFNTYIPDIFGEHRIIFPPLEYLEFYIFVSIGGIAAIYFLYRGNDVEVLFSLMFIEEAFLRLFYFSAFLHYSIFWLILGIMISVMFIDKFPKIKSKVSILGVAYLILMLGYNYYTTYRKEVKKIDLMNGHDFAFKVLTPCDYALNGYFSTYNLKAKDAGYYAILLGQIDVLGEKVGIAPRDNLNELIRTKKPKIISAGIYWDTYWEERGKKIPAHTIDRYLLETYYDYSGLGDIFILKPQYQKHQCVYNGKEWKFMD